MSAFLSSVQLMPFRYAHAGCSTDATMTDTAVLSNLSADRPIQSLQDDLLGRGDFVIPLASAIRQWRSSDSLVIAVYGPWGHGKTSVKNLILSLLEKADDAPAIVEFNPWNWTGEDRLLAAFFEEVGDAIGEKAESPDRDGLSLAWKRYAARLTLGGTALEHLRTAAEFAAIPWAPLILDSFSKAAKSAAAVSEQASHVHSAEAEGLRRTAEELKKTLHDALAKLERPVLVVMDDIDRLTNDEVRLLFRLIKSNADFPNLIYLLFFEREIVERALTGVTGSGGRAYLEKIVQAGFDLPYVQQADVNHVLAAGLDSLLSYEGVAERFDSDRWQEIYRNSLQPFFRSLRDVRRFLSTFSFELGLFYRDRTLDINFVDLIALEVLRVFEPELYKAVADAKEMLSQTPIGHMFGGNDKEDISNDFTAMTEKASECHREAARVLLAELFPKIGWALKGHGYGIGFEERWEQALRVCHYRMFDRYFILGLPKGDVPISLLQRIIQTTERESLVTLFAKLHDDGLLSTALERLESYATTLDLDHVKPFVTALLDIDDLIPFSPDMSFGLSADMSVIRIIRRYLLQEKDQAKRSRKMLKCLRNCTGVWLPIRLVALQEREADEKNLDRYLFDDDGFPKAKAACLKKIRESMLEGIDGAKLLYCLYRWKEWAGVEEPRSWCEAKVRDVAGALRMVRACLQTSYVSSGSRTAVKHIVSLQYVTEFMDVDVLGATLESVLSGEAGEYQDERTEYQVEIEAFGKALRRRAEGKPDDWRFDED